MEAITIPIKFDIYGQNNDLKIPRQIDSIKLIATIEYSNDLSDSKDENKEIQIAIPFPLWNIIIPPFHIDSIYFKYFNNVK